VLTHELGHVLALGDSTVSAETMYGTGANNDIHARDLLSIFETCANATLGDKKGYRLIWGCTH